MSFVRLISFLLSGRPVRPRVWEVEAPDRAQSTSKASPLGPLPRLFLVATILSAAFL